MRFLSSSCLPGTFEVLGSTCVSCDLSCATCEGTATNCLSCVDGKYLDQATRICLLCNAECKTCISMPNKCTNCFESNYLEISTTPHSCLPCTLPCKNCSVSSSHCTECYNGFYPDSSNTCQTCYPGCKSCTSSSITSCSACFPGYFLSNTGKCLKCHQGCSTCIDSTNCSSCFDNFKLSGTSCSGCPAICGTCPLKSTDCNSCNPGFFLNGITCSTCSPACTTCTTTGITSCQSCANGFYLSGSTCAACPSNCTQCSSGSACTKCISGYYLDSSNTCVVCVNNCLTCELTISGVYNCLSCFKRNYLDTSSSPKTCKSCISNCNDCSNPTACLACLSTYYVQADNTCTKCINNCITCTSPSICSSCQKGYYLSGSTCSACSPNCETCTDSSTCSVCQTGFYLSNNACVGCSPACRTCHKKNSGDSCDTCFPNYDTNNDSCEASCYKYTSSCQTTKGCWKQSYCHNCNDSCASCPNDDYSDDCLSCNEGSSFDSSQLRCKRIPVFECNRATYSSSTFTCSSCYAGFTLNTAVSPPKCNQDYHDSTQFLDNSGSIANCPYGCLTCTSLTVCTSCESSHLYLLTIGANVQCAVCPYPCDTCNASGICLTCLDNFVQSSGASNSQICVFISIPYRIYSSVGNSFTCVDGYYLDGTNNSCIKCEPNCQLCTGVNSCTDCSTGFYLSSGTCLRCPYNCLDCNSSGVCTSCVSLTGASTTTRNNNQPLCSCLSGYYETFTADCAKCDSLCATCQDTSLTCLTCVASSLRVLVGNKCLCSGGYFEQSGVCVLCDSSCKECSGSSQFDCISCASPFVLDPMYKNCKCQIAQYLDISGGISTCTTCPTMQGCQSCSSHNVCILCQPNMVLSSDASSCVCSDGFSWNSVLQTCQQCQIPFCKDCLSDITTCTSCYAGSSGSSCSCSLSSLNFDSGGDSCTLCHYSCETCDGFERNNCLSCESSTRIFSNTLSTCTCIDGTFDNSVTKTCDPCHYSCFSCTGPSAMECTKCAGDSFRKVDSSITQSKTVFECICKDAYFDVLGQGICSACSPRCATCSGNRDYCVTCDPTSLRTQTSMNTCDCPNQHYDDGMNSLCLPCHYSCFNCIDGNPTGCVECPTKSFRRSHLISGSPIAFECPCDEYYFDDGLSTCKPCHYSCNKCNGILSTQCTICETYALTKRVYVELDGIEKNGICDCGSMYRDTGLTMRCQSCQYRCSTCDATEQCTKCEPTRKLVNGDCLCVVGRYETGVAECQKCSTLCGDCLVDPNTCISCDEETDFRYLVEPATCKCKAGYFDLSEYNSLTSLPTLEVSKCEKCINNCKTCSSNILGSCLSCFVSYNFVLKSNGECVCVYGFELHSGQCNETYDLTSPLIDKSLKDYYTDIFTILLKLLKYLSWIHLLFIQPFQTSIGFKAHQILYMILFSQSKFNNYIYDSLLLIREIDPFSIFSMGNIFSIDKDLTKTLNGKFEYLSQSCQILYNGQGLIASFILVVVVYGIIRLTIFRKSVLFPTEIYKQVHWREKLQQFQAEYFFPMVMNILQIIMIRLFFFAIVDIFSGASNSTGKWFSSAIIGCYAAFNAYAFHTLFLAKQGNAIIKMFFSFRLKKGCEFYYFMCHTLEFSYALYFGIFSSNPSQQIIMPMLCFLTISLAIIFYQPFQHMWENIISFLESLSYVASLLLFQWAVQFTYNKIMDTEQTTEFILITKIFFFAICVSIGISLLCISLRILKGLFRICKTIFQYLKGYVTNGNNMDYLWQLQENSIQNRKKQCSKKSTSNEFINKLVLQEYINVVNIQKQRQSIIMEPSEEKRLVKQVKVQMYDSLNIF